MTISAKKLSRFTYQRGFTLIEILISATVIIILSLIALASYNTFARQINLDTTTQNVISTLRLAQTRTKASEADTRYGVHFETTKYVLFSGDTYTVGAVGNKEYLLSSVEIYQINLNGGGSEVIFDRIRGTTSNFGSVDLRLIDNPARSQQVLIGISGEVSLENPVSPTGTRLTDSRHLHFDLGWSIQSKTTLTLTFTDTPNPTVVKNIPMATYFDSGKTVFDWSGTVNVNGSNQVLRVHTHLLDAFSTILSIQRDRRYNDKALNLTIDGLDIVTYTAAGTASVGASGGTMTAQ
ncbi:MAG: type II secretion system protein [bacterium]|nr:type II secretion system protein [bacterium]